MAGGVAMASTHKQRVSLHSLYSHVFCNNHEQSMVNNCSFTLPDKMRSPNTGLIKPCVTVNNIRIILIYISN